MKQLIPVLPLLLATFLCSCFIDKSPLRPIESDSLYTGTNGFILNGGDYWYAQADYGKASVGFSDPRNEAYTVVLDLGELRKVDQKKGVNTVLTLALPKKIMAAGDYAWTSRSTAGRGSSFAVIEQDDEQIMHSVKGTTKILQMGEVGEPVIGTFFGTLEDDEHTRYSINGRFHALRVH
jgi:hypothetical protein